MSTSDILQHLYSLDVSSPGVSRLIYRLIRRDKEEQYLSSLQESESARLVDFLDQVRTLHFPLASGLRNGFCRPLMSFQQPTWFSHNVCTNYEPSAVIAGSYHPRTPYLVTS